MKRIILCFLLIVLSLAQFVQAKESSSIKVFAAASTTNVITDVAKSYEKYSGRKVTTSFAASSTLARQIEQGAPAHLYVSANIKWMDYLIKKQMVHEDSKTILFSNRLALITANNKYKPLVINRQTPLRQMLGDGYLTMANPDHTPMGMYAKQSLTNLGLWTSIEKKIAKAKDVRAALMLVERQEVPLGIVYITDSRISSRVKVLGILPPETHSSIVYLTALVKGQESESAQIFLDYMRSDSAKNIYEKHGFLMELK